MKRLAFLFLLGCSGAAAQTPPNCHGTTVLANGATGYYTLQYQASPRQWLCVIIPGGSPGPAGPAGPAGPPGPSVPAMPTDCITSYWDGTAWTCVPTNYLTAQ